MLPWICFKMIPEEHNLVPVVFCVAFALFLLPAVGSNNLLFVALRPNTGHGHLILEVFLDHTQRRTTVSRTPLDE
jgi:hypothetical protein